MPSDKEVPVPTGDSQTRRARIEVMAQAIISHGAGAMLAQGTGVKHVIRQAREVAEEYIDNLETLVIKGDVNQDELQDLGSL